MAEWLGGRPAPRSPRAGGIAVLAQEAGCRASYCSRPSVSLFCSDAACVWPGSLLKTARATIPAAGLNTRHGARPFRHSVSTQPENKEGGALALCYYPTHCTQPAPALFTWVIQFSHSGARLPWSIRRVRISIRQWVVIAYRTEEYLCVRTLSCAKSPGEVLMS